MKNIFNRKLLAAGLIVALTASGSVMAAIDMEDLTTAANGFTAEAVAAFGVIGLASVLAAYGGVIWKWIKAAVFS
jgi:hypothetical protein